MLKSDCSDERRRCGFYTTRQRNMVWRKIHPVVALILPAINLHDFELRGDSNPTVV